MSNLDIDYGKHTTPLKILPTWENWSVKAFSENVPPSYSKYSRKSAHDENENVKKHTNRILSDAEWEDSRVEREKLARGLDRPLNSSLLISCLKGAHDAHLNGATDKDVLSRPKRLKRGTLPS